MKKMFIQGICLWMLFGYVGSLTANDQKGSLKIQIIGIPFEKGEIVVYLYNKDEKLFGEKGLVLKSKITKDKANVTFENVTFDEYAVFVYQDENLNGKLDHRFFIPAEPMGFSNDFRPTFFTGKPKFSDLKFEFNHDMDMIIKMNK